MVRIHLRIYRAHDADLYEILEEYEFDFCKALYCSLSAYCQQDVFAIKLPQKREKKTEFHKAFLHRYLKLDPAKDAGILELISQVPPRRRNCFLKSILRLYLCIPCVDFPSSNYEFLRAGKRMANAAAFTKKQEKSTSRKKGSALSKKERSNHQGQSPPPDPTEQADSFYKEPNGSGSFLKTETEERTAEKEGHVPQEDLNEEDLTDLFTSII